MAERLSFESELTEEDVEALSDLVKKDLYQRIKSQKMNSFVLDNND